MTNPRQEALEEAAQICEEEACAIAEDIVEARAMGATGTVSTFEGGRIVAEKLAMLIRERMEQSE